uniref:Uncharacterized protein n=1 Tax=Rhizophora mucronata TaxID=61149 RepID=A0A2P2R2P1_RHIMU
MIVNCCTKSFFQAPFFLDSTGHRNSHKYYKTMKSFALYRILNKLWNLCRDYFFGPQRYCYWRMKITTE